jgi:hypothetical protein
MLVDGPQSGWLTTGTVNRAWLKEDIGLPYIHAKQASDQCASADAHSAN